MLYHPYILLIAMVLFIAGALDGALTMRSPVKLRSRHPQMMYAAYLLFLLALALYYGYERSIAVGLAGGREAFRATGLLVPHVVFITLSTLLLTLSLAWGVLHRGRLFRQGTGRREQVHVLAGALGIVSYILAVLTGIGMYIKAGVL